MNKILPILLVTVFIFSSCAEQTSSSSGFNGRNSSATNVPIKSIEMKGHSMETTIHDGQVLDYKSDTSSIKRGDIVVIQKNNGKYLKRVIALPGETIRFEDEKVFIKEIGSKIFMPLAEPYLSSGNNMNITKLPSNINTSDFIIPEGSFWLMGDNRPNSSDSRQCFSICREGSSHFVDQNNIVGIVIY